MGIMASERPRLRHIACAAIANLLTRNETGESPEFKFLLTQRNVVAAIHPQWGEALLAVLKQPSPADTRLLDCAADLQLTPLEILSVALAMAVDDDPIIGRVLTRVQAPMGAARPTLGLLATAMGSLLKATESPLAVLLNGAAMRTGLLVAANESAPVPERSVAVPLPLCLALSGHPSEWPGVRIGLEADAVVLAPSTLAAATRQAKALVTGVVNTLVVRAGSSIEARAVADAMSRAIKRRPAFVETDKLGGIGVWLTIQELLPVFTADLGPAERKLLPTLPGYRGPVLAIAGRDGAVENERGTLPAWTIEVPGCAERVALWKSTLGPEAQPLAEQLGRDHRHSAGRIAQLGHLARHHASLRQPQATRPPELSPDDIATASWTMEGGSLDALAEPQRSPIPDEALVAPVSLRKQLDLLALRCRSREGLADSLGITATARYRAGVRALFCGPSGTGKTLAAGWLATRLNVPLYRIDLAGITSKYIGETEKNLSKLLSQAENAEVVLLFDEADSLFGKRTDIRDSNDRFANAQTNYLLQRIESYDGIVLLTSNTRDRFDAAFTRRLDFILEFPVPDPGDRRALWIAHLGEKHTLTPMRLNQLSALVDICGGHIRNAVLTASVVARHRNGLLSFEDVLVGLETELRKLGRQVPMELTA
jgi:hypothetical protein